MDLAKLIEEKRVIVCVGGGGVGKTTTAAAIAVSGARRGKRVLCLTIDPAKRLATSLGLQEMSTEEQTIDADFFREQGLELKGSMSAMMLDPKSTFDDLVKRLAGDPLRAQRILDNRLYQYISTSLAGTQEYMAMEKLNSVKDDPRFDLIVLDTPPTSNALDFLNAPERLTALLDSPALRWLVQAFSSAGKLSLSLVGRSASFLIRGLSRFTGSGFFEQVAEFLSEFNAVFGGFQSHAENVARSLRSEDVAFVVVTRPTPSSIDEALFFTEKLAAERMTLAGILVNYMHAPLSGPLSSDETADGISVAVRESALQQGMSGIEAEQIAKTIVQVAQDYRGQAAMDLRQVRRLNEYATQRVRKDLPIRLAPALETDVHDLKTLALLGDRLAGEQDFLTVDGVLLMDQELEMKSI